MVGDILQPTHLLFILVVALLVLGPKRLPEVGRSLGKGIRDFRGAMAGIEEHTNLMTTPAETLTSNAPAHPVSLTPSDEPIPVSGPVVTATAPAVAAVPVTATASPPSLPPLEEVAQNIGLPADPVGVPRHEPAPDDYAD